MGERWPCDDLQFANYLVLKNDSPSGNGRDKVLCKESEVSKGGWEAETRELSANSLLGSVVGTLESSGRRRSSAIGLSRHGQTRSPIRPWPKENQ